MSMNKVGVSKFHSIILYYFQIPGYVILLGILLRLSLLFSQTNFDFESYKLTADSVLNLIPPWRSYRYNYGLTWSLILGVFREISFGSDFFFRFLIISILSVVDLSIAVLLVKWFGKKVGSIFFSESSFDSCFGSLLAI